MQGGAIDKAYHKLLDEETRNLPCVQQGLHATAREYVQLADYNETKPRRQHMPIDEWIAPP